MAEEQQSYGKLIVSGLLGAVAGAAGAGGFLIWLGDRIWPENLPPTAKLEVTPPDGTAPLVVTLSAAASSDPDGDDLVYIWSVDNIRLDTQEPALTHTFTQAKPYIVTLEVRDSGNLVNRDGATITVTSPFDLNAHLERVDNIKRLIDSGEYLTAHDITGLALGNCDVAGEKRCAELHFLKAQALLHLDRLDDARQAMAAATNLQPDDLSYALSFASILIIRGEYPLVIQQLQQIIQNYPTATQPPYFLAIANALAREYQAAQTRFESVARTSRRHEHRAKFGSVLVKLLLTPEDGREELEPDVKAIACAEAELAGVSLASSQPREPDIFCFRQLAGRLEESDRTWLFSMMEQNRCG